jgi:hypothetical protein
VSAGWVRKFFLFIHFSFFFCLFINFFSLYFLYLFYIIILMIFKIQELFRNKKCLKYEYIQKLKKCSKM